MNIKKKLQNPFALVAQGFVAGAILFWTASAPAEADSQGQPQAAQVAAAAQNLDA